MQQKDVVVTGLRKLITDVGFRVRISEIQRRSILKVLATTACSTNCLGMWALKVAK